MSRRDITRALRDRPALMPFVGTIAVWTLLWTILGVEDVLERSIAGTRGIGASLDMHEIFDIVFVAATTGVRWALGMAILLAGGWVVWRGLRR